MVKVNDFAELIGKVVTAQVDTSSDGTDEDYREYTGKLEVANEGGIVIKSGSRVIMVTLDDLLDVDEVPAKPGKLLRRWLADLPDQQIRQHLADRHGIPVNLAEALTVEMAVESHNNLNHSHTSHSHGEKPRSPRGRPRKQH